MTFNELAKKIAKKEGKKSSVTIGNIREILTILSDEIVKSPGALKVLIDNGIRRVGKKK